MSELDDAMHQPLHARCQQLFLSRTPTDRQLLRNVIALVPRPFVSSRGRVTVEVVSSRILTTTMAGCLDLPLAQHFLASLDAWVKLGGSSLLAFHDWEKLDDYESEARQLLTPWSKANRSRFEAVHMLVPSRTIAYGIQIVNALTGDVMTAHGTRATFDKAWRQARWRGPT